MLSPEEQHLRQYIKEHLGLTVEQLQTDPIAFTLTQDLLLSSPISSTDPYGEPFDTDCEEWFYRIENTLARKHLTVHNIDRILNTPQQQDNRDVGQYFEHLYTDVVINKDGTTAVVTFQPQRATPIPIAFVYTPTIDDLLQSVAETYNVYFNKLLRRQRTEDHHNQSVIVTLRWMSKNIEDRMIIDVVMYT